MYVPIYIYIYIYTHIAQTSTTLPPDAARRGICMGAGLAAEVNFRGATFLPRSHRVRHLSCLSAWFIDLDLLIACLLGLAVLAW